MIDGRKGPPGVADRESLLPQHLKSLRAGHFVDQVQADEKLRLSRGQRSNRMGPPELIEEGVSHSVVIVPEGGAGRKPVVTSGRTNQLSLCCSYDFILLDTRVYRAMFNVLLSRRIDPEIVQRGY